MKRYTRISPNNALCIMPRKAIAWLMLGMAILTIFSFISIEIKRIIWLKSLVREKEFEMKYYKDAYEQIFNTTLKSNLTTSEDLINSTNTTENISSPLALVQPIVWNPGIVDEILAENSMCFRGLYLLILVASAPTNFEQRGTIRKTWANPRNHRILGFHVKTVFMVGRASTRFFRTLVQAESDISNDMLVGDYYESYKNLTSKVIEGLTWAFTNCEPTYTLKTDDDCFINVQLLINFLSTQNPIRKNLYAGHVRWASHVVRKPNSRWYLSVKNFPKSQYVPYVNGAGYIMTYDVLQKFVEYSELFEPFPSEDVFVGTVLNMAGVKPTYSTRFVSHSDSRQKCNLLHLFVIRHVRPLHQFELHKMANDALDECPKEEVARRW
ncbi:n-acetyllactosaminide beta-1,3-N-acetylglucosaminyltransferase 4 [Nephila pilipes]|uniref:Hexosyltransferase n=1 Tax=Nephila pilipes TaxID=299642 RepID=A0A8X6TE17_NEPPI|nr:n-acetyllactosaminide beta-1,3-N-acetylglucosaminyltransferase 4 [Nephila pilipes]